MPDRQQQTPLKKVQHTSNLNKSQLMEGVNFNTGHIVNVNKQEVVNSVRVKMIETNCEYEPDKEEESLSEGQGEGNKRQAEGSDGEYQEENLIRDEDDEEPGDGKGDNEDKQKQPEEYSQAEQYDNENYEQKVSSPAESQFEQQLQQQVFIPTANINQSRPSIQPQPQEQTPITQKPHSQSQSQQPIAHYNKIKYTYDQMKDQEIALSSASIHLSQHLIGTEEVIGQSASFVRGEGRKSVICDEGVVEKGTSLEEIKSSESAENKHEEQEKQLKAEKQQNAVNQNSQKDQPNFQPSMKFHQQQQSNPLQSSTHQSPQQPNLQSSKPPEPSQQNLPKASHQSLSQPSDQQSNPDTHFDLERYASVEPILQQLLNELKSLLKNVKADTGPTKNSKNSKFFIGRSSRSQSNTKQYKNNTLVDIMERRKQQYHVSNQQDDTKLIHNLTHQQIAYRPKEFINVGMEGNTSKPVPFGLGNLGDSSQVEIARKVPNRNTDSPDARLSGDMSRVQDEQRQRLIVNRNKINQILASSVSNFKKPESNKNKSKQTSYMIRKPQSFHDDIKADKIGDTSFVGNSQSSHQQIPLSRKVIRSTNFSRPIKPQSIQQIPAASGKNTIEQMKQKAFFLQKQMEQQMPSPITVLLKLVKKYLQVIAEGRIDDIESFLNDTGDSCTNLNELINRKKLFKTALYFERASIVAGVCYGYLMITQERGYLAYQMQQLGGNPKSTGIQQASKASIDTLKQQAKQVLKYMINLASFSLNNCKLITKTINDHILAKLSPQSITDSQPASKQRSKPSQHQLIQKQIYKRNIQTIKLNIQYTQETLYKMFAQTQGISRKLALDEDFGESFKNVTRLVQKHTIEESFCTLLEYFAYYLCLVKRQRSIPFLAVAPNPYLDAPERYTLVIDFISVFCYGTKKSKTFVFRPYSQHFLYEMAQYFDIVAICDALPQHIDKIVDLLDTKGVIKHRLYKYHMVEQKTTGRYTKSLQRMGRQMNKVVLLDVEGNRISQNMGNTIFITEWKGSKNDSVLAELCSVLLSIVVNGLDCGRATQKIEAQMKINLANGIRHINFGLDLKEFDNKVEDVK